MSLREQVTGTARNVARTDVDLLDLLPPSIAGTLLWARDTVPRGLGYSSRTSHITGVIALTVVLIIASATVLTFVAVAYFIVAFPVALARYIPAVEARWPLSASAWPFWTVQSTGFGGA
jgi:hypothetical protein